MKKLRYVVGIICIMALFTACGSSDNVSVSEEEADCIKSVEAETVSLDSSKNIYITNSDKNLEISLVNSTDNSCEIMVLDTDNGEVLQQFSCNISGDIIELQAVNFNSYQSDIVVVSIDSQDEEQAFLYQWDYVNKRFYEEAAEIPLQYEIAESYNDIFTVTEVSEAEKEVSIYKITYGKVIELRKWIFNKNTLTLLIEDCVTGKYLFEGDIILDIDGNILYEEYYQDIFWDNISVVMKKEPENIIKSTYVSVELEGLAEKQEFVNKEAMLEAYGFDGEEPFYLYYDMLQRIQLEFYLNEQTGFGCGIFYDYWYTPELEEKVNLVGFAFDSSTLEKYERDTFSLLSVTDSNNGASSVEEYEEQVEYRKDGKIGYFVSTGKIDWLRDAPVEQKVIEIDFIYREDGSLYHKNYIHNAWIFSTFLRTLDSYYDERERLIYEYGYITHGHVEYYYIYTNEDDKPDYCIYLDWMGGECWPTFISYQ